MKEERKKLFEIATLRSNLESGLENNFEIYKRSDELSYAPHVIESNSMKIGKFLFWVDEKKPLNGVGNKRLA